MIKTARLGEIRERATRSALFERIDTMTNLPIDQIRKNLGRTSETGLAPRPAIYPPRVGGTVEAEMELFSAEVTKLGGDVKILERAAIPAALKQFVLDHSVRKATCWRSAFLEQLGIESCLTSSGCEYVSATVEKHELALCDLGITEADHLLAETGTLVLTSSSQKPRAVSLLPKHHLAFVQPTIFRPDLHHVFAEAKHNPYLVFITGPSRTADIELTVTLGVHGPKNLTVWIVVD